MSPGVEIEVDDAPIDEGLGLRVRGLEAGARVELSADARDAADRRWRARASFAAGADGVVDLRRDPAVAGDYEGVDADGLIWAMSCVDEGGGEFAVDGRPVELELVARAGDRELARACVERRFSAVDLVELELEVERDGLAGRYFAPAGAPAEGELRSPVLLLGGSEGALLSGAAKLLAGRGHPALALAYFGAPGLPELLAEVPLERVDRALDWLLVRPEVGGDSACVLGFSRGAELALSFAAREPRVRGAIALMPSAFTFAGTRRGREVPAAWTHGGEALPVLPVDLGFGALVKMFWRMVRSTPIRFVDHYREAIAGADPEQLERAAIPVEDIRGPLLLIAAGDDQVWPSVEMSARLAARRRAAGLAVDELELEGAGHLLRHPGRPTTVTTLRLPEHMVLEGGGTPAANARGAARSWQAIVEFLAELDRGDQG